jgi:hypothetical protein
MKDYEKTLLSNLQTDKSSKLPLAELKKSLGVLSDTVGNPLKKTEISITITTVFGQLGVGIVAPGLLPPPAMTKIPVFLFGLTDYYGGYQKMNLIIPPINGWIRNNNVGISNIPQGIYGFNFYAGDIFMIPFLTIGDMVLCYTYVPLPGLYVLVIIHCNNVAYGTFLNSFVSDLITIDVMRYILTLININQFLNPLIFGTQTLFGKVKTDNIDPRMYIRPKDPQQQISDIPLTLPIDKTLMLGFYMDYNIQAANFILFVSKVEQLTHIK